MRNSNCVAIAPTATISNIIGVGASIEPEYQNIYVKSNLSGEFTVVNEHLVAELKKQQPVGRGDGRRPQVLRRLAREDRPRPGGAAQPLRDRVRGRAKWIVEAGARRQKWIDQAQSLNIYMAGASGKKLDETYKLAWVRGLKTTYYLRTLAATSAEKSTGEGGELNAVPTGGAARRRRQCRQDCGAPRGRGDAPVQEPEAPKFCAIDDPTARRASKAASAAVARKRQRAVNSRSEARSRRAGVRQRWPRPGAKARS